MCFKATNDGRGGVAVDAGRDDDARESRARALIVGRLVGVLVRDPSVVVDARSRSFVRVRSFVRSTARKRFESNRIEIEPFREGNRTSIDGSIARHREVGIFGRSRDARETNR